MATDEDDGLMARMARVERQMRDLQSGFATLKNDVDRLGDKTRNLERDIITTTRRLMIVEHRSKGPV